MDITTMIAWAAEEGFAAAAVVDTKQIVFDSSFRTYCEENLCGQYGANHSCPPDCGTPEQMRRNVLAHPHSLVLQTIWEIADYTDEVAIKEAKRCHNEATIRLVRRLRAQGVEGFAIGASGCALCSPCTRVQGKPCAFPQDRASCMSAYCIFVKKLADLCAMEYNCGPGLLAFFGMYVFD